MADTQSASHKIFGFPKRKLQYVQLNNEHEKKPALNKKTKKKRKNGYHAPKPKYILHPYHGEESDNKIIILQPPNAKKDNLKHYRANRAPSAGTKKSKKTMKKPKNHRLHKHINKPSLKPSDSDTTNTTTQFKKSHEANQRKKRLFGIDSRQRVVSFKAENEKDIPLKLNKQISNSSSSQSNISKNSDANAMQRKAMSLSPQKRNNNHLGLKNESNTKHERKTDNSYNHRKESASFTTDDLCITYKKGQTVSFRPSGRNNDEWKKGVIHDITPIDNVQYLSIMTEINDTNDTFATFYIPLNDKQRVRPYNSGRRIRTSRSNTSYSNTQLMRLGIGGVFTDYDVKDVIINTQKQEIIHKNDMISIPNINSKPLQEWSSLEVAAWLIPIQQGKYSNYIPAVIENNVNGKALTELTFVTMMKLSKYQMNVTDCTDLLNHIKVFKESPNCKARQSEHALVVPVLAVHDEKLKFGVIETSDDIDIPLLTDDDNSNQVVIEQGRFWRLFYFPKLKSVQYDVDKPVNKWTPYEVSLWIHDIFNNKFSIYAHYFIQFQIDGQSLLNITRKSATDDLKMISPNIRRLFFDELRALSTLQPCGIRQYNDHSHHCPNQQQIKRLTHRLTHVHNDIMPKMTAPKRSQSANTSPCKKEHGTNDYMDVIVAQKIIKGIHQQTASRNNVVIADLILRDNKKRTLSGNTEAMHNFVSGVEDDDEEVVNVAFQHLNKGDMDFYNDTNLHFIQYSEDNTHGAVHHHNADVDIMAPNKAGPGLCVAALFNATDANTLSDEPGPGIEQINKKFDIMEQMIEEEPTLSEQPLSIGTVASIDHIEQIEPAATSLASNVSMKLSSDHTLSPRQDRGSTLLINLTTHENKTSLLVEGSQSTSQSQSQTNMGRLSDNKNIHASFAGYGGVAVTDEQDELEIDVWDTQDIDVDVDPRHNYNKHCFLDSFMDHGFDDNDPLFAESLTPMSSKYGKQEKVATMTVSASFPFDIEEKMNEVDGGDLLCHEPNVTLEIDQ